MNIEQSKTELFNKYVLPEKDFIYRVCLKHSRSEYECKEFYSEVLFRIFKAIDTYNPLLHIRPWLYTIITRIIGRSRTKFQRMNFIDIENLQIPSDENEEVYFRDLRTDDYKQFFSDDIVEALGMIKPASRKALLLQQAGYSMDEIAGELYNSRLIKSNSTVSARYYLRVGQQ
ncbi:RNA polymerase sigma factor [Dysgonomonas termitidis]